MSIKIRDQAPEIEATAVMPDGTFADFKLSSQRGKWVVLFFYPLDFTFVCPTEIIAFSEASEAFRAAGAEVFGCSVDSQFVHLQWTQTPRKQGGVGALKIPLIADIRKQVAKDYGVLVGDGSVANRGVFIIDPKGLIRQITINDIDVGRNVDEVLRVLQATQHVDAHPGEGCPINWKPGSKNIK
eukprot:CAMPEP_0173306252 /NCGR_PEP_ID=MMETSP1143-20121109/20467_1 /TAXON_ID=483371 /ORGANISM="non described non described, Strain CCMP2298" /LENGTH=183 /DNA_ID=CAMNT_0014247303 /DNA_START=12 /DNA_END=560 /DNA_ORIENTATION=+